MTKSTPRPPVASQAHVGAELAQRLEALAAASGHQHAGAELAPELDGEGAHARGRGGDEHAAAVPEAPFVDEVRPRGEGGLRQGRGGGEVETPRDRHELPDGHGHLLTVAAAGQQRHHAVAAAPAVDALAHVLDLARALQPGDLALAGRRRVEAADLEQVGAVQGAGAHPHQHLARTRKRGRDLAQPRTAGSDDDRAHGLNLARDGAG
jgi:hypothetical protein